MFKKIDKISQELKDIFNNTSDLITYKLETNSGIKILISYIEGLVDKDLLDRDIIKPIILNLETSKDIKSIIHITKLEEMIAIEEIAKKLSYGYVGIFIDEFSPYYLIDLSKWEKRSVEEPKGESVIRGPKEGFIEDLLINKSMLRRKIRSTNLVFEDSVIGRETGTGISIAYIKGIVNEQVLEEVKSRISAIDIDGVLESGYIEELIEDNRYSMISTISNTQKPDVVAGKILEGRVALFCDGTPHVLTMPKLFIETIQTSEDYYQRPYYATFLRGLRIFAIFVSILLPGFYVALQTFHQEMIPSVLLITMAGAKEGIPFPTVVEALLMSITLELIKESGIRLPKAVGSAVSIVGALVLGQAAVEAGIISSPMVIVLAATAIAEFIVPSAIEILVLYRFILILLGGFMGLYGITCGIIVMVIEIVSLDSFGIPYGFPIAPMNKEGLKDSVVRFPIWKFLYRPEVLSKRNVKKQEDIRKK